MKELKLTKQQQRELDDFVEQHNGLRVALKSLAFDLGVVDDKMWDLATSFAGEREIHKINVQRKKAVIILEGNVQKSGH